MIPTMRRFHALALFAAGFAVAVVTQAAADPILLGREEVELPAWTEVAERPHLDLYATDESYESARTDARFRLERLTYESDGLSVVAYLYTPRAAAPTPLPTVVFNRGSYVRQDTAPELIVTFHRLARQGYAVLAPMYRGSEGAEGTDEMGGADVHDLLAVADLAAELPAVAADRLYLYGESRGGMMVLQALRDGFPARAAAVFGAPTDFFRLLDEQPERYAALADGLWPGWREERDAVLGRRSAITWAGSLTTPLLVMHGGADDSIPVGQSLRLAERLAAGGVPFELVVFGYGNHVLSEQAEERDARSVAWFRRH